METNKCKPEIRTLLVLLLLECVIFLFSGVGFHSLYNAPFFSFNIDVFHAVYYFAHIPQFIVSNLWVAYCLDALTLILILILLFKPLARYLVGLLIILLFTYYITLTGYHTHSNYQMGFVIVLFPFLFRNKNSKAIAFECMRYYLLFFYASSAYLKAATGSIFRTDHLSQILQGQFLPYFLEGNTGYRTDLNIFLINHHSISYTLYLAGFLLELFAVIGFFTKKYDKVLCISLLLFHFVNWFLMDIAPFGQITFICLLLFSTTFAWSQNKTVRNEQLF